MPTYSYACTECDDRFDAVQSFTEDTLTTCAKCAGRLRKLFNSVGVVFKGSGFYRTDVPSGGSESSGSGSSTEKSNGNGSNGSSDKSSSDKSSGEKSSSSSSSSKSAPATAAS